MSQKEKRICKCCGKVYEYCPHCGKNRDELWRNITDTEECREVLNIVSAYNIGRANKDQVINILDKYKVKDYSKYKESISKVLKNIFEGSPKTVVEPIQKGEYKTVETIETSEIKTDSKNKSIAITSKKETSAENTTTDKSVTEANNEIAKNTRKRNNRKRKRYYTDVDSD